MRELLTSLRRLTVATVEAERLARLRILFGVVVLGDLLFRLEDFYAFYERAGLAAPERQWPLFALDRGDSRAWLIFVFALAILCAVSFTLGLFSRTSNLLTWFLLRSVQARNPMIQDGGDALLAFNLLWLAFADSGAALSLDVRFRLRARRAFVWALPLWLIQAQLGLMYALTAVGKLRGDWLGHNAVQQALLMPTFARAGAERLAAYPLICGALTLYTLLVEVSFVPLVWSGSLRLRRLALGMGTALHVGIALLMRVGIFSPVVLAAYCAFLPLRSRAGPPLGRPVRWRLALAALLVLFSLTSTFMRSQPVAQAALAVGFDQRWQMFAAAPRAEVRWRAPGQLTDGTRIDVLGETIPELSGLPGLRYRRWLKLRSVLTSNLGPPLLRLGRFLCARYNSGRSGPLLKEYTLEGSVKPIGEPPQPWHVALTQSCLPVAAPQP